MRHLDRVVRAAVHPKIQLAERTQRIVRVEARKSHDVQSAAARGRRAVQDIGRPAAAADEHGRVSRVGVGLQCFVHPERVAVVVREARDEVRLVEIDRADAGGLGQVHGDVACHGGAAAIPHQDHLSSAAADRAKELAQELELDRIDVPDPGADVVEVIAEEGHVARAWPFRNAEAPENSSRSRNGPDSAHGRRR